MKNILKKFILLFSLLCGVFQAFPQKDFTHLVKPVYKDGSVTSLSIYDACPESPDGKYVCFVVYPNVIQGGYEADPVSVDVMIKDRLQSTVKKIATVKANNHNGANALWIDSLTIAFLADINSFVVYNVKSGEKIMGPVKGELGHKSFGGNVYFSRCSARSKNAGFKESEEGVYILKTKTGDIKKIVSKKDILNAFMEQNPSVINSNIKVLHVEPSPDEQHVFFDFRHDLADHTHHTELHGCVNANGTNIRWVHERPMHVVWYDNQSMMGVYMKDPEKKICRFDLDGNVLDTLGGTATHVGASPDRQWYVGESAFYTPEPDGFTRVYLYKKSCKKPMALLAEWKNSKVTWDWKAHVNPAFSADGQRIYFIRSFTGIDKFEAVYIDISSLIKD